jgi:hypothetical protein
MNDAATVGVGDGIADGYQAAQQLAQGKAAVGIVACGGTVIMETLDGISEGLAFNETHRVTGLARRVLYQAIHGHDAGMLQLAGDFCLLKKTAADNRVVSVATLDALQGNFAA